MSLPDERQLLDDIGHASGHAASLRELCALYGLARAERVRLRRLLTRLAEKGRLVKLRGNQRYGLPRPAETVEALLKGTRHGYAFASPDDPGLPDLLVPARHLGGALDGDRVEVAHLAGTDPARPAGEVVRIIERGRRVLVGVFEERPDSRREPFRVRPFNPRVPHEVVVPERFAGEAQEGDFVEVTLLRDSLEGGQDAGPLRARVRAVLGRLDEPGTDVRVILTSYGLSDDHSPEAEAEAERAAARRLGTKQDATREDLRGLDTVTIDGETARDFDDAVSIERRGKGYRLWVHVADVAEYVREGGRLDAEAYDRATSVYLLDRAIHMLPESLSAGACSLRPDEDRLALTLVMDHDARGQLQEVRACESLIRSNRRMTYTQMKRMLVDGDEELRRAHADLLPSFELMGELAGLLIQRREERGGLDFDLPVPIFELDASGLPTDITSSERNLAHRIIEEFMIAANAAVARKLEDAEEPALHRNHEPPPPDKLETFRHAAEVFGHRLASSEGEIRPADFRRVLQAAAGRSEEHLLTSLALRSMSLARYEPVALGHFGLALEHYAHFTSPIRRYPDLVVHRALKRLIQGKGTPPEEREESLQELVEDGRHCSSRERLAEEAERALKRWKACRFMAERVGKVHEGRVSGLAEQGLHVMIEPYHVDGFVHFRDLDSDWYERDERRFLVRGRDSGRKIRPGDALKVRVTAVDLLAREIRLEEARPSRRRR